MPERLVLLRHAEKPDDATGVHGVDERGEVDAQSLSVRGWQRAGALARWLAPSDGAARFGVPGLLCAAPSTPAHPSRRPLQTLLPLSRLVQQAVRCDAHDDKHDAVAARLLAAAGTVVVCGRHAALPALATALARRLSCEDAGIAHDWPADRFDVAWVFDRGADGRWRFTQVPQQLLDGDRAEGIDRERAR